MVSTQVRDRRDALALADHAACHTTMSYRPPELWEPTVGDPVDGRPDVWSLGCVLWFVAFGYGPRVPRRARTTSIRHTAGLRTLAISRSRAGAEARSV